MEKKANRRCQICRDNEKLPGHAYCLECRMVLEDIQRQEGRREKHHLTAEQKAFRDRKVEEQIRRIELEQLRLTRTIGPCPWVVTYPDGKKEFFVTIEAAREAIVSYKRNECLKQSKSPQA